MAERTAHWAYNTEPLLIQSGLGTAHAQLREAILVEGNCVKTVEHNRPGVGGEETEVVEEEGMRRQERQGPSVQLVVHPFGDRQSNGRSSSKLSFLFFKLTPVTFRPKASGHMKKCSKRPSRHWLVNIKSVVLIGFWTFWQIFDRLEGETLNTALKLYVEHLNKLDHPRSYNANSKE